ncbi:hypothetical protein BC826DRAFT_993921 [Russula brevipes]|nr:hypothetical protein BC826DRAFT_993921 [Russula brevipes]
MDLVPARLQRRNVEVFDSHGAIIAGFWQYGTLKWDEFYRYLTTFVVTPTDWSLFQYDPAQERRGARCPPGPSVVQQGHYILLATTGEPTRVGLVPTPVRPRNPARSSTPSRASHYRLRACVRDGKCLITGLQTQTYSRLQVAHIFPREHEAEIDSLQNLITLRSDLQDAWDNYEFGVDPKSVPDQLPHHLLTNGNADINGLHLQLGHIQNPSLRPLDELFIDHFMQGVLKHVRGSAEPAWTEDDEDDVFGDGSLNLSNAKVWETREGKERFELALEDRLLDHRVSQYYTSSAVP